MEKKKIAQAMSEKLEYICLDLEQIPETLKYVENINFKPNIGIEENKYRQYRFVSPKELEILLSPCNRLEDTKTKYSKAKPLVSYLEPKTEEEKELHKEFLRMLEEVDIDEIKQIEEQQQLLNKKIPFKVRYPKNYLWQIYYSEIDDKYFMIVTTEDQDYSTFFYVLKKQLEKKKAGKIFVPINNIDYSKEILNKTEIESLENYLWTFTNDWPSIYEVYDKTGKISLQIVGQTQVLGNIKSEYKVKLTSKIDASKFFKLVKALYIVQTEVPEYYKFEVQIDKQGEILVVGLGNIYVTPDALGPKVINEIEVTRHIIKYLPQYVEEGTRMVSAISPGVLGTTGIETLEILKGIVDNINPKLVIVIDALASRSIERISSTVQLSDTGIVPGAGVGNTRTEISQKTLGIPVIAIGIPTVVETAVLVNDSLDLFITKLQEEAKSNDYLNQLKEQDNYEEIKEALLPKDFNLIVTPKEIDDLIENMSEVVSKGINMSM